MPRVPGEYQQGKGLDGVQAAKTWMESTTRFELPWQAWGGGVTQVTMPQLNGKREGVDMKGVHLDPAHNAIADVYIEVKNHSSDKNLSGEYDDFLITCYSAFAYWHKEEDPAVREFIFVTWHPFGPAGKYNDLTTAPRIEEAIDRQIAAAEKATKDPRVTKDQWDPDIAARLADRLTLVILSQRLPDLQMSDEFLGVIRKYVTDKGDK